MELCTQRRAEPAELQHCAGDDWRTVDPEHGAAAASAEPALAGEPSPNSDAATHTDSTVNAHTDAHHHHADDNHANNNHADHDNNDADHDNNDADHDNNDADHDNYTDNHADNDADNDADNHNDAAKKFGFGKICRRREQVPRTHRRGSDKQWLDA
ncbi:hypothetical protein CCUG60885_03043 [Mycobacteroides salmoniphilum]|uniref:Uncharacterized protein n=1 Tax=Mycobacteroides salmoniphilum TaxID=404941 RepID=A0A4R8SEA4_9MYCO|nr:hypothetical protein CCUG60885_03043 [Mycobacteroides salmoniphilum]TEA06006.1 hypothetical protein CCUG60883_01542 [Mycobacteroides salmoniphilum]